MSLCVRLCAEDVKLGLVCSTLGDPLSTEGDRYISEALDPGWEASGHGDSGQSSHRKVGFLGQGWGGAGRRLRNHKEFRVTADIVRVE